MKKPENLETSHDVLAEKPENFFANFSQSVQKIFSKKVAEISPKLDYLGIFEFLENETNSQVEKENFIKNLEKIDLENILPILENEKIKDFHKNFIEKLDGIELTVKKNFYKNIPQNLHLINILKSEKIFFQTKHALFRMKNIYKYSLNLVLVYVDFIPDPSAKSYFVNRFLEEQKWEEIEKILPKISNDENDFIAVESLMQVRWNLEFDSIKKYLISSKISIKTKKYLAWKCEEDLDKNIILPFLVENEKSISYEVMVYLIRKITKNVTLEEWKKIMDLTQIPLASDIIVALDKNISDAEITKFLQEKNVSNNFYKHIFPYREKKYKNILQYCEINGEKIENYRLSDFVGNGMKNSESTTAVRKYMTSIFSKYQSDFWWLFSRKMRENPEKSIYDLYRETAKKFLEKFEKIDENERQQNNQKLVKYQKEKLTKKEIENAQKIWIDMKNFDLTMYMRYGHQIDYPEIAEFMAIFVDEYIVSGRSRYFSHARVLPRNVDKEENIYPFLQSLKTVKYFNKIGIDAPDVMHIFASCMYFSHSANAWRDNIPNIISRSMKPKNGDIHSDFELEAKFYNEVERKDFEKISIFEIMQEVFVNLQKLEENFDNLLKNKQ